MDRTLTRRRFLSSAALAGLLRPGLGDTKRVRVAGIVLKWIRGDKEANYRRIEPLIRAAAAGGAKIVVTTECFLDGYAIADKTIPLETYRALGEPIPAGPYFRRLARLADELDIHLVAGMLEADADLRYNTTVILGPDGRLIGKYHKQFLEHEAVRNTPGAVSSVHETPFGNVGVMICADRRDELIVRRFFRENRSYIVFVHPAEFLVTGPDGAILDRTILGDRLLVAPEEVGGEHDSKRVFYFDLPLARASTATSR